MTIKEIKDERWLCLRCNNLFKERVLRDLLLLIKIKSKQDKVKKPSELYVQKILFDQKEEWEKELAACPLSDIQNRVTLIEKIKIVKNLII